MRLTQAREQNSAKPHASFVQAKCGCGGRCGCNGSKAATASSATRGSTLPKDVRRRVEPLFKSDFAGVRVHDDRQSHQAAAAMGARAYTSGQDIHFAAGEYRPQDQGGLHLLAHELSHTIQQGEAGAAAQSAPQAFRVGAASSGLEREADRAADQVVAGQPAQVTGRVSGAETVQRQDGDGSGGNGSGNAQPAAPRVVPPVDPTPEQATIIEDARRAAAIRTQQARFRTSGIAPDERTAERYRREARRLARIMFDWPNPNMEQVTEIVLGMAGSLTNAQIKVAAPGDPECGNRAGYVRGFRIPIVLCDAFFDSSPEQRIRTMIHESAHLQGIGEASVGEGYCQFFDCQSSCPGGFDSADSWAHYVHCLTEQVPDQPPEVIGDPNGPQAPGATPAPGGAE